MRLLEKLESCHISFERNAIAHPRPLQLGSVTVLLLIRDLRTVGWSLMRPGLCNDALIVYNCR